MGVTIPEFGNGFGARIRPRAQDELNPRIDSSIEANNYADNGVHEDQSDHLS